MKDKLIGTILMCIASVLIIMSASDFKDSKIKEDTSVENDTAIESDNVIKIWYQYKGYEEYIEQAVASYKEKYGLDMKVVIEFVSEPGYYDYINNKSLEGKGPDIFVMGSEYAEKAYLLGIAKENTNTDIYNNEIYGSAAITSISYKDKIYGYPLGFDVSAMVTNTDYCSDDIVTFEDIKYFADNFNDIVDDETETVEVASNTIDYSRIRGILAWDVKNLLFNYGFIGNGVKITVDDRKTIDISNNSVITAANSYFLLKDYFSLTGEETYEDVKTSFSNGETVFVLAGTDIIKSLDNSEVNFEVNKMPDLTSEIPCQGLSYTDLLAVNPMSDDIDIAVKLAEYISYEYAENMYDVSGIVSCRKDIVYEDEHINQFLVVYDQSIVMPNIMETEDYCILMEVALKNIWNGEDIQETFKGLQDNYSERIK